MKEIEIEERSGREITHVQGRTAAGEVLTVELTAPGSPARNPAFDVTPARLVTGLITERGDRAGDARGLAARCFRSARGEAHRRAAARGARADQTRAAVRASPAKLRAEIVSIAQRMSSSGLSPGKAAMSRCASMAGMLITPTGMHYSEMRASDIVEVRMDGRVAPGQRVASSEWRVHLAIYKARVDVGAVVHTHSLNATALSCLHRGIPAFHYMVAEVGWRAELRARLMQRMGRRSCRALR